MTRDTIPSGRCPSCSRRVRVTDRGVLAIHGGPTCPGSGMPPKGGVR